MQYEGTRNKLVFISHEIDVPAGLAKRVARFELRLPDTSALEQLVREEALKWQKESGKEVTTNAKVLQRLVKNLCGLTISDARRLVRNVIVDDDAITEDDLPEIMRAKYQLLNREDVLSFEFDTTRFSEVGGMRKLKRWLQQRENIFHGLIEGHALDTPRGVLLLGVQGCGKSLAAKAIAGVWKVPLLRFDFGAIYDKYIGESERNLRQTLKTAEVMAPCVMWIDEIEKGIAGGNDDGTSKRILGSLLTWLAENRANVFIVATANNIDDLPPELIRKGRLDEIFFVDLPKQDVRKQIFAIHLDKRQINQPEIDLARLAAESDGFSGAEIEQVVVSAVYGSYGSGAPITTEGLLAEINTTRPLAVVMDAQIQKLKQWAESRTVPVD